MVLGIVLPCRETIAGDKMKILLFNPMLPKLNREVIKKLSGRIDCKIIEISDYEHFSDTLRGSLSGDTIVVFSVYDENDLCFLESIKDFLLDVKLLINEMTDQDIFSRRVYKLYPRLSLNMDSTLALRVIPDAVLGIINEQMRNETYHINHYRS